MFTLTMEWWPPASLSHTMNEPCMNDKCNVNSENKCMRPQNQIWCCTPMESHCRAQPMYSVNSGALTSATSTSTPLPLGVLQLPRTHDPPYT